MKIFSKIMIMMVAGLFIAASSAMGLPTNDRDPAIALDGQLQDLFNLVIDETGNPDPLSSPVDAEDDQSEAALWMKAEGLIDSYLVDMVTGPGGVSGSFGIYNTAGHEEVLLSSSASTAASFGINDAGDLYVGGVLRYSLFGFDFGFFYVAPDGSKSYTEDSKNGDIALALSYLIPDGNSVLTKHLGGLTVDANGNNDWMLAFEDATTGGNTFRDGVFYLEDLNPVPEPGSMAALGFGLIGLIGVFRKRSRG